MTKETTHQFSPGVKILLERIKTNPQEFKALGTFERLADEVYMAMQKGKYEGARGSSAYLRMLRPYEVEALHEALMDMERPEFDAWVMGEILGSDSPNYEDSIEKQRLLAAQHYNAHLQGMGGFNISNSATSSSLLQNAFIPLPHADRQVAVQSPAYLDKKPKSFWSQVFHGMLGR